MTTTTTTTTATTTTANCPDCTTDVAVPEDALVGELVTCRACGIELEVLGVNPPTLAPAPDVEEDWGE